MSESQDPRFGKIDPINSIIRNKISRVSKCDIRACLDHISSLGTNAKRMLDIGIVKDHLADLGFSNDGISRSVYMFPTPLHLDKVWLDGIEVYFNEEGALVKARNKVLLYKSSTWQQDLINEVKEILSL